MKKALMILAVLAIAVPGYAALTGTHSEDFECDACHSPHTSNPSTDAPLWGKASGTPTAAYANPNSTMTLTPGAPAGSSLLCMSCHDGVTTASAPPAPVGDRGQTIATIDPGFVDTATTHPISMAYDAATLNATTTRYVASPDASFLVNGKVECASCHDIHVTANDFALRDKVAGTYNICGDCHIK